MENDEAEIPVRSKDIVLITPTKYTGLSFQLRSNVLYSVVGHVLFVCLQISGLNYILILILSTKVNKIITE